MNPITLLAALFKQHLRKALCLFICTLAIALPTTTWAAAGIILNVIGVDASVLQRDGHSRPAQKGVQLYIGDTVSTGAATQVQIRMIDEATISIRPNSQLKIEDYTYSTNPKEKQRSSLQLVNGGLRTVTGLIGRVNKADFALKTPNTVIGIRGTDFETVFLNVGRDAQNRAGTYTRVFLGATVMDSPNGRVVIGENEAGFMGMNAGDKPQVLPSIPDFMNPNKLTTNEPVKNTGSNPKTPLLITLRFTNNPDSNSNTVTSSSRELRSDNYEERFQVLDGERAGISMQNRSPNNQYSQSMVEVLPRLNGDSVTLQLFTQQRGSASPGSAQSQQVGTTINVPLGIWVEVSGRGPWSNTSNIETASSREMRAQTQRVYVKIDAVKR
jgi:hypothetical protein